MFANLQILVFPGTCCHVVEGAYHLRETCCHVVEDAYHLRLVYLGQWHVTGASTSERSRTDAD